MKRTEIANFIKSLPHGKFVGIEWIKANGEYRKAQAVFGVCNPTNATKPGQGQFKGVTFDEALDKGVVKFFEPNKVNADGSKGAYRSATIAKMQSITWNGVRHEITD